MERILRHGMGIPTAWPLRTRFGGRVGAAACWAAAAIGLLLVAFVLLAMAGAPPSMYAAFALASGGFFLCTWGSLYGVEHLVRQVEGTAGALDGPTESIREVLLDRLRRWVSPGRSASVASVFGVGITGCMLVHNLALAESSFARAFAASYGALYVPVFVEALSIGLGVSAIAGAVSVSAGFRSCTLRRTFLPAPLRGLSRSYLTLATLALATYFTFLAFLPVAGLAGLELTLSLNVWAVVVGGMVLLVYLYPQWAIHRLLVKNREVLVREAVRLVESLGVEGDSGGHDCERVLRALDYVRAMEEFPTVAFRWKELVAVLVGYVLPAVGFLLAQAPFIEAWFR